MKRWGHGGGGEQPKTPKRAGFAPSLLHDLAYGDGSGSSPPAPMAEGHTGAGPPPPSVRLGLQLLERSPPKLRRKCHSHQDLRAAWGTPTLLSVQQKRRSMRWLILHESGSKETHNMEKRQLVQSFHLDVPLRDMRLLDNQYSNYETLGQICVRERAIVFSMEHVKLLIMQDKVIVPLEEPMTDVKRRFITYLEQSVREHWVQSSCYGDDPADVTCGLGPLGVGDDGCGKSYTSVDKETPPFELHVLEAALAEICSQLAREVDLLQAQAQPALEELTRSADQPNLERVRRVKTGHQRLLGRVNLVSETLERLMEDDADMLRMCLSRTQLSARADALSNPALSRRVSAVAPMLRSSESIDFGNAPVGIGGLPHDMGPIGPVSAPIPSVHAAAGPGSPLAPPILSASPTPFLKLSFNSMHGHSKRKGVVGSVEGEEERGLLLDVENLLESYFTLVDSTQQRLMALGEYIDDTEDLINIQLDYSRNKLIRFEIVLTTATFSMGMFNAVAGMLGENLHLPSALRNSLMAFVLINASALMCCVAVFLAIVRTLMKKKVL